MCLQVLVVASEFMWLLNCLVIEKWPNPFAPKVLLFWRLATAVFCIFSVLKIYVQWVMILVNRGDMTTQQVVL